MSWAESYIKMMMNDAQKLRKSNSGEKKEIIGGCLVVGDFESAMKWVEDFHVVCIY